MLARSVTKKLATFDQSWAVTFNMACWCDWYAACHHAVYTDKRYSSHTQGIRYGYRQTVSLNLALNGAAASGWAFSTSAELGERRSGEAIEGAELIRH